MANDCYYHLRVYGKKINVCTFYNWLIAEYNYEKDENGNLLNENAPCYSYGCNRFDSKGNVSYIKYPVEHHIGYRIFEADADSDFMKEADKLLVDREYKNTLSDKDDMITQDIFGYCAWSIASCMVDYSSTGYIQSHKGEYHKAIGLLEASEKLDLKIEAFSQEPGMAFSEHYYFENGDVVVDECADFNEYRIYDWEEDNLEEEYREDGVPEDVIAFLKTKAEDKYYLDDYVCISENLNDDGEFRWDYLVI